MMMHVPRRLSAVLSGVLTLSFTLVGCSTASKDISATYVSPLQFQTYDCDQLKLEAQRIQARVIELGGRLDQAASNDKALMGVGLILFWPALFALGGTKQQEAEYARLRGENDGVQQAAIQKKCMTPAGSPEAAAAGSAPAPTPASVAPAASATR